MATLRSRVEAMEDELGLMRERIITLERRLHPEKKKLKHSDALVERAKTFTDDLLMTLEKHKDHPKIAGQKAFTVKWLHKIVLTFMDYESYGIEQTGRSTKETKPFLALISRLMNASGRFRKFKSTVRTEGERVGPTHTGFVLFDIDSFKKLNDYKLAKLVLDNDYQSTKRYVDAVLATMTRDDAMEWVNANPNKYMRIDKTPSFL